jgi:hypothetical protein
MGRVPRHGGNPSKYPVIHMIVRRSALAAILRCDKKDMPVSLLLFSGWRSNPYVVNQKRLEIRSQRRTICQS